MKTAQLRPIAHALALSVAALFTLQTPALAGPALPLKRALELAEEALASKSPAASVYIESIALQKTSMLSGKSVWTVSWSESLPASKPGNVEVGVEIGMDGSVVHLVKGRSSAPHQRSAPPR